MKTKLAVVVGTILASLVLAGCNNGAPYGSTYTDVTTQVQSQPPVSSSIEIDDIESEVDGTTLYEEDFSDL
jgi:hypothetical protein